MYINIKSLVKSSLIRLFCWLFYFSKQGSVVLLYHSINDNLNDSSSVSKEDFYKQIQYLIKKKFKFLQLADIEEFIKNTHNKKGVMITFDDCYEDVFINAVPILERYKVPAVFFMPAGLSGKEMSGKKIMTWDQIKYLASNNLFEIGSHTMYHSHLARLNFDDAIKEIKESLVTLRSKINREIISIAYPYGRYTDRILTNLKPLGFRLGFSVIPLHLYDCKDLFLIPRMSVNKFSIRFFPYFFKFGYRFYWKIRSLFLQK